ncbi:MAG: disulfide bond formation protein B [Stappiaceae bacterium]
MSSSNHQRLSAGLFLLIGLATIGTAWGFQIYGGYVPCALCLEQRVPYYVALPLVLLAAIVSMSFNKGTVVRLLLLLGAAAMVYGAGLGFYHAGAEWEFWPGPSDCGGGLAPPTDANSVLGALKKTRVVSCTEASWRMLGLSFAGWNAVASAGLALIALWGALSNTRRAV